MGDREGEGRAVEVAMKEGQPKAEMSEDSNSGLRGGGAIRGRIVGCREGGGMMRGGGLGGVRKAEVSVRVVRCSI